MQWTSLNEKKILSYKFTSLLPGPSKVAGCICVNILNPRSLQNMSIMFKVLSSTNRVYPWLIKRCPMKSVNHEQCSTMEFWEDSTDELAIQFHILISKIFSLLRRFLSRFGYPVLILSQQCLRKEASFPASQKTIRSHHSLYILFTRQRCFQLGVSHMV